MDMLPVDPSENPRGERLSLGGDEVLVLAGSADTGGALFAVEITMLPGGGPPVMHRHDPGEVYYVLEGEFTFYTQEPDQPVQRRTAVAGQTVPLAGGTPHTIRNESDLPARAFSVHAPGAPMEGFMRAVTVASQQGTPSMQQALELAAQNGITLLGPIPTGA